MKKTVTITIDHTEYVRKSITKTVEYPIYVKDEYGYILGCIDGKTTIQIGINGVQVSAKGTHSIETHNYVSSMFIAERSKPITKESFHVALQTVNKYIISLLNSEQKQQRSVASKAQ